MKKLLVVEDDPLTSQVYCEKLTDAGYVVDAAASGRDAVTRLEGRTPDLVLLDLMLGDVNGVEVLQRIRSTPATRHLPVVAVTGDANREHLQAARSAGATYCLDKSGLSPVRLLDVVRASLLIHARKRGRSRVVAPAKPVFAPTDEHVMQRVQVEVGALLRRRLAAVLEARADWAADAHRLVGEAFRRLTETMSHVVTLGRSGAPVPGHRFLVELFELLNEIRVTPERALPPVIRTINRAISTLPRILPAFARDASDPSPPPLVLTVDDDPVAISAAALALEHAGLATLGLEDPNLALLLCERQSFDVVLLDLGLPVMDGMELCRRIQKSPLNAHTPVIFVTGEIGEPQLQSFSWQAGFDYLLKPAGAHELAVKVWTEHFYHGRPTNN